MQTLRESLADSARNRVAIGHFNISDLVGLNAVAAAARRLRAPVLVGTSEGERTFIGVRQVAAVVKSIRDEYDFPIFLNADHTHSVAKAEEAARAGYDMISFDGSALAFDENVRQTREAVEAIKSINTDVVVEGELGYIGSGSEIHDKIPESSLTFTRPDEAREFAEAASVDVLAPAVGNMHGLLASMVRGEAKKRLDIDRIAQIKAATGLPLTLHGGSATDDNDFRHAIEAGMTILHVSTELRLAWRRGLEVALAAEPDNLVPYQLFRKSSETIEEVVTKRLNLFNNAILKEQSP
jgi:fructose-bisphosphate aldolase class II